MSNKSEYQYEQSLARYNTSLMDEVVSTLIYFVVEIFFEFLRACIEESG